MSYILHFLCLRPVFNSRSILSFDILLLDMIHGHYRPTPRYMIQYPPLRHITDGYTAYQAEDLMDTCPEYHHGMARLYCVWGFYWVVFLFTELKTATRQFSGVFSCDSRKPKVCPRVSFSLSLRNKQRISDGSLEMVAGGWRVQADNWPLLHHPTTTRMMTPRIERDIVQSPRLKWTRWFCALQIVHEIDQMGMKESRMTNFQCIPFDKLLNFLLIVWELRWIKNWMKLPRCCSN